MDTLAPAVADAFDLLKEDLYRHLDGADSLALKYQDWEQDDIDIARELIPDLVLVLRGLLFDHQVRPGGDCRTCASAWPCPVVTLMHSLLKDPNSQLRVPSGLGASPLSVSATTRVTRSRSIPILASSAGCSITVRSASRRSGRSV